MADDALEFRIPLGRWAVAAENWIQEVFNTPLGWLADGMRFVYDWITTALHLPPWWLMVLLLAGLAWWLKSWKLAVGSALGFTAILGLDLWEQAMDTLGLVAVATLIAVLLGIPLGVLAAYSRAFSSVLRPILDFLQTMPPMVYLIPGIAFFGVGVVTGMVATILFSMAPSARLTELGIRGVDHDVVEAGEAFGAGTPRILRQIQLPLAVPTIMAGINQVIMLALSMVVIAGMVGAGGLGGEVTRAISGNNLALGVEAGTSVVILAMFLDRITAHKGRARGTH